MRQAYADGLAAYREKDWDRAEARFGEAAAAGDAPAWRFLERISRLRAEPRPEPWDGVWRLTEK